VRDATRGPAWSEFVRRTHAPSSNSCDGAGERRALHELPIVTKAMMMESFGAFVTDQVQLPQVEGVPARYCTGTGGRVRFIGSNQRRRRDTSGAARTNSLAAASSSIHRPMAS
jgi:hypothetical protein